MGEFLESSPTMSLMLLFDSMCGRTRGDGNHGRDWEDGICVSHDGIEDGTVLLNRRVLRVIAGVIGKWGDDVGKRQRCFTDFLAVTVVRTLRRYETTSEPEAPIKS